MQRLPSHRHPGYRKQKAATLLESVMVIGLLIVVIFSIIEFARFYSVKATMTRAVKKGLELAIRDARLLTDVTKITADPTVIIDPEVEKLRAAFRAIDKDVNSLKINATEIADVAHDLPYFPSGTSKKVLILRPGEAGSYKFSGSSSGILVSNPASGGNFLQNMENSPVLVEMHGKMKLIIPFFGDIPIQAQAIGYVEKVKRGIENLTPQFTEVPICGDTQFDPSVEICDNDASGNPLPGSPVLDSQYCTADCQVRERCGNALVEKYGTYEEKCDFGKATETTFNWVHNQMCTATCQERELPKCYNFKIELDEVGGKIDGCDVGMESMCNGYWNRKRNGWVGLQDKYCAEMELKGYLLPEGYACVEIKKGDSVTCNPYKLPTCPGGKEEIDCPGESERAGQEGRYRCFRCVGDGPCITELPEEHKDICFADTWDSRHGIKSLPGIPKDWFCNGCHEVTDNCNNFKLDTEFGEVCDPTAPFPHALEALPDDQYCSNSNCKPENRCGNGIVETYKSYYEECEFKLIGEDTPHNWGEGLNCVNCKIKCPDITCSNGESMLYDISTKTCYCRKPGTGG